jgi:NADPH-dependent glutamate synthase beta subunit-like oxidoreductase
MQDIRGMNRPASSTDSFPATAQHQRSSSKFAAISCGATRQSNFAQLGCEFCEDTNCIQCREDTATNIPGVYAAGNASRGVQLVIAAAAEGMQAAFAINSALLDADAASNALRDREPGQPTPSDRNTPGSNEAVD